jgi:hypothetical protein
LPAPGATSLRNCQSDTSGFSYHIPILLYREKWWGYFQPKNDLKMFPRALNGLAVADVDTGTGTDTGVAPVATFPQEHPIFSIPVTGSFAVTIWQAAPSGQEPVQEFVARS